jgi:hypothetical protein
MYINKNNLLFFNLYSSEILLSTSLVPIFTNKHNGHGQGTKENLKSLNIKIFSTVNGTLGLVVYLTRLVNNLKKPYTLMYQMLKLYFFSLCGINTY